jgi:peptide/nickel transport system permease protein
MKGILKYILFRLGWAVVVSMIIVTIAFFLLDLSPDPNVQQAAVQAAQQGESAEQAVEQERKLRGLDKPVHVRYLNFMQDIYTLEWGWSDYRSEPVEDAVLSGLYYTAQYSVPWTLLTITIGPILGMYSASEMYSWKDHIVTFYGFFGFSIPNFFFGIVLLFIFGSWLGWVEFTYNTDVAVFSLANAKQLILPVFVLWTGSIGGILRVSRNESAEFMNAEFMKTAKAKGVSPTRAWLYHVLRPTMVPLSTAMVSALFGLFLGASVLVEQVFSIPGLGRILFQAAVAQDTDLFLGTTLAFVFLGVIGNLIEDLVFTLVDPRISYSERY